MGRSAASVFPVEEVLFRDGLGDRLLVRDAEGKPQHEWLLLRPELCAIPAFEFSLNQRLKQLERFHHPAFVRVHQLARVSEAPPRISLQSDYTGGTRLSDVLAAMEHGGVAAPVGAALFVVREILHSVCGLHQQSQDVAHGALAPERIVVTGKARITDYTLGSAIEQLRFSPERYWKMLRVAVPSSGGAVRINRRTDVAQVGMIALALFAGRPLRDPEHVGNLGGIFAQVALPAPIKAWLLRMVHLDPKCAYLSAMDAAQALNEAISETNVQPVPLVLSALGIRVQRPAVHPIARVPPAPPRAAARAVSFVRKAPQHAIAPRHFRKEDDSEPSRQSQRFKTILKVGLLAASLAGAFTLAQYLPALPSSQTGTLVMESIPAGASLVVDGKEKGTTPLTLTLKSGRHQIELRGFGTPRAFSVAVPSGASVSHSVQLAGDNSPAR